MMRISPAPFLYQLPIAALTREPGRSAQSGPGPCSGANICGLSSEFQEYPLQTFLAAVCYLLSANAPVVCLYLINNDNRRGLVFVENALELIGHTCNQLGFLFTCGALPCDFDVYIWHEASCSERVPGGEPPGTRT